MKCSKCNIEMIKGGLFDHGTHWIKNGRNRGGFFDKLSPGLPVVAWKCETCNKVELTIESTTSPTRG